MNKLRLSSIYLPRDSLAPLPTIKPFLAGRYPSKGSNSFHKALAMLAIRDLAQGSLLCASVAVSHLHVITTRLCLTSGLHQRFATKGRLDNTFMFLPPTSYMPHRWLIR